MTRTASHDSSQRARTVLALSREHGRRARIYHPSE
jgi:hypothetical protein